jgi:diguanylate cyclase (GGDEF)-like protein
VLRNISKAFMENLREEDTVGRVGGEEFGILLPETDEDAAYKVLERMRLAVKNYRFFIFENFYLNITISIGYVRFGQTQTLEQVIKCADIALYKSKNSGRDTISKF